MNILELSEQEIGRRESLQLTHGAMRFATTSLTSQQRRMQRAMRCLAHQLQRTAVWLASLAV